MKNPHSLIELRIRTVYPIEKNRRKNRGKNGQEVEKYQKRFVAA